MSPEEYVARRAEINKQLAELKNQYIKENVTIEPESFVLVNGMKAFLKGYQVQGERIYPLLYAVKHDGTPHSSKRVYVASTAKLVKI